MGSPDQSRDSQTRLGFSQTTFFKTTFVGWLRDSRTRLGDSQTRLEDFQTTFEKSPFNARGLSD